MANPGQPTISLGASGEAVKRLERALRRTPNLGLTVDGVFGPQLEAAVKQFQQGAGLTVGRNRRPSHLGRPTGRRTDADAARRLDRAGCQLATDAADQWRAGAVDHDPQGIDGDFGPHTKAAVVAFQAWGGVAQDGIVGDQTWAVSLHAASATLETAVGLQFVIG